jgi:sodium transport system ATP-binding protein
MIELRQLTRAFHKQALFTSQAISTPAHGLVAIRGANGSGKTTLLRILATLTAPSGGDAWVDGQSVVSEPRKVRAGLGFVPSGEGGMFRKLTGRENLMFFASLCGLSERGGREAIDRVREMFPLDQALATRFGVASSGMRQSLLLARALLHDPPNLLLDEPARALDPAARKSLWRALEQLGRTKTIVYSSHDPADWDAADQLWQIEQGVLSCSTSC